MILVDTSIWIDHLRRTDLALIKLLNEGLICIHPFVIGELALGNLKNREVVINSLQNLPQACVATDIEVMHFITQNKLYGMGIGYIDVHLLAATRLTGNCTIWTRDKRLKAESQHLHLSVNFHH